MAPAVPFIPRSRVPRSISPAPVPVEASTAIIFVAAGLGRCSPSPRAGADAGFEAEFELIPAPGLQTVSGDGDLGAVVAPSRGGLADFVEGKIGQLAGGPAVRAVHWSGYFVGVGVGVERDSMEGQAVGPGSSPR